MAFPPRPELAVEHFKLTGAKSRGTGNSASSGFQFPGCVASLIYTSVLELEDGGKKKNVSVGSQLVIRLRTKITTKEPETSAAA